MGRLWFLQHGIATPQSRRSAGVLGLDPSARRDLRPVRHFFRVDDENGGGGGPPAESAWRERRMKELEGMAIEAMRSRILDLEEDNRKQREEIHSYKQQINAFDAERKELEVYRSYGKPDELNARLEQAKKTEAELIGLKRERAVREAAKLTTLELEVAGKKEAKPINADKLAELAALKGLEVEIGEGIVTGKDGKPVQGKIAQVKKADGKLVPLADYLRSDLAAFADWLADSHPPTRGTPVVPQPAGGGTPTPANPARSYLERAYARPDERGLRRPNGENDL